MRTPPRPPRGPASGHRQPSEPCVAETAGNGLKRKRSGACRVSATVCGHVRQCKPRVHVQGADEVSSCHVRHWAAASHGWDCTTQRGNDKVATAAAVTTVASRVAASPCSWSIRRASLECIVKHVDALPPLPIHNEVSIDVNREAVALGRHNLWLFVLLQRYLERGVFQPDEQGEACTQRTNVTGPRCDWHVVGWLQGSGVWWRVCLLWLPRRSSLFAWTPSSDPSSALTPLSECGQM